MIYLDTSCLIKVLLPEPESDAVRAAFALEECVIVSPLAELEADIQLTGSALGGSISLSQLRRSQARLLAMRNIDPFHFRPLPAATFSTALRQHRHPQTQYCRAMDRLHLAAMEELGVNRLMTLDQTQADVAASLKYSVLQPGKR